MKPELPFGAKKMVYLKMTEGQLNNLNAFMSRLTDIKGYESQSHAQLLYILAQPIPEAEISIKKEEEKKDEN